MKKLTYVVFLTILSEEEMQYIEQLYDVVKVFINTVPSCCQEDNTLIITDIESKYSEYKHRGYACLALCRNGERFPVYTPYISEGLEQLDYPYCNLVFMRLNNLPMDIAETSRCLLREITEGDIESLYSLYQGRGITDYMEPLYANPEEEVEYTRKYIENVYGMYGYGIWVIIEKSSGRMIGRAGIELKEHPLDTEKYILELGFMIATDKQRQGYATEVVHAILAFAQLQTDMKEVYCYVYSHNTASRSFCLSMGFSEGIHFIKDGKEYVEYSRSIN